MQLIKLIINNKIKYLQENQAKNATGKLYISKGQFDPLRHWQAGQRQVNAYLISGLGIIL